MRNLLLGILGLLAGCAHDPTTLTGEKFARDSDACRAQVAALGTDVAKRMVGDTCMLHKGNFVLPLHN